MGGTGGNISREMGRWGQSCPPASKDCLNSRKFVLRRGKHKKQISPPRLNNGSYKQSKWLPRSHLLYGHFSSDALRWYSAGTLEGLARTPILQEHRCRRRGECHFYWRKTTETSAVGEGSGGNIVLSRLRAVVTWVFPVVIQLHYCPVKSRITKLVMNSTLFQFGSVMRKGLQNGHFLEQRDTQNLTHFCHRAAEVQLLPRDGDQHIHADGNPDLRMYRVRRQPEKRFDPKVLLDPLEEQFHLPATLVQLRYRQRRQQKVVRQKHKPLSRHAIDICDSSQQDGIAIPAFHARQSDARIASQSRSRIDLSMFPVIEREILFGPRDEEGHRFGEPEQPGEIDVSAVHDIERARLDRQIVQRVHVGHLPGGNMDKTRDIATNIDQGVQLDGTLSSPELCPGKQRQAQIDGGGVEGVDRLVEVQTDVFVGIQPSRPGDEEGGQIGVDSPVAQFVGVGQRASRNAAANADVIKFFADGPERQLDVAETFAVGQLGESHAPELVATEELTNAMIAGVSLDASVELMSRNEVQQLRENRSAFVHVSHLSIWRWKEYDRNGRSN